MDWSPQQEAAIAKVDDWLTNGQSEQVFRLFGFAGTGKTTLAKHFSDLVQGRVLYGAYTGKAALVLRQKGCHGATTIHQMIYRPRDKSKMRLLELEKELANLQKEISVLEEPAGDQIDRIVELKEEIDAEHENLKRPAFSLDLGSSVKHAPLVIIDEVSMVGTVMGMDLCSFATPILVLGDPAQLPPVRSGGYFSAGKPDVMLKEIHRQAEGSPIIAMATRIRQGEILPLGEYGEGCAVISKGTLSLEDLAAADQVLVGRNNTRRIINRRMRTEHFGRESHLPVPGDRLVCLRNNHDLGLLNGGIWNVLSCDVIDDDRIGLTVQDEESERVVDAETHRHTFEDREIPYWEKRDYNEFDYGYALTVHKAQGSQWDDVVVVDESRCFRNQARKWMYTAVTRAAKKVRVIKT